MFAPGRIGVNAREMDVHVPETRKQELSGGIDGVSSFRELEFCRGADGDDAAGFDENGLVRLRRASGGIDDRDVDDGKLRRRLRRKEGWNDEENRQ